MLKLILMGQMVRRSNVVYQDGLRNVNSMIFNSQVNLFLKVLKMNTCIDDEPKLIKASRQWRRRR